jgi:lipopolysaccharide/colanic/teichoic acid biosynthesis glycosyltransferase
MQLMHRSLPGTPPALPAAERAVPARWHAYKRAIDLFAGGIAAICAAPIVALAALAIVAVEGGNPFFAQDRVGLNGRRFRMFKLRTMVDGAHDMRADLLHLNELDGPVFKIKQDPRLHPLGSFLRRSSIDELPNLLNVLRGEMSLVGPRPALKSEVEHYDAFARRRLSVMPGITGLWQIGGRCSVSFEQWMALDNAYVDTWSPLSDLIILLRTIPAVIRKDGAH